MNLQSSSWTKLNPCAHSFIAHTSMTPTRNCTLLKDFHEITEDQLIELMKDMNKTTCELDPCSSKLVYKCLDVHKGTLTTMVNISPRQGLFIQDWKLAIVKPLIKTSIWVQNSKTTDL